MSWMVFTLRGSNHSLASQKVGIGMKFHRNALHALKFHRTLPDWIILSPHELKSRVESEWILTINLNLQVRNTDLTPIHSLSTEDFAESAWISLKTLVLILREMKFTSVRVSDVKRTLYLTKWIMGDGFVFIKTCGEMSWVCEEIAR